MNEGTEIDSVPDTDKFDISHRIAEYQNLKGEICACGTCLKVRKKKELKSVQYLQCQTYSRWLKKVKRYWCLVN